MLKRRRKSLAHKLMYLAVTLAILAITVPVAQVLLANWQIYQQIDNDETRDILKEKLGYSSYNYTELFIWEHQYLNFTWENIDRKTNPLDILECGEGRCGEFAILFAALCESQGYESRLVINLFGNHEWTQIKVNGTWIHFDSSLGMNDTRVSDPLIYERDWKNAPILALAFGKDGIYDVTNFYRTGFWVNIFSIEMFSTVIIVLFLVVLVFTLSWTRQNLYRSLFKRNLHLQGLFHFFRILYIFRFFLLFCLPYAIAVLARTYLGILKDQDLLLNGLIMGLALVTFFAVEFPALTKPIFFASIIEDCTDPKTCQIGKYDEKNECKFKMNDRGPSCKAKEFCLEIRKGRNKIVFFRLQCLSLHTLKNCVVWINFPNAITLKSLPDAHIDFRKDYEIQYRNNACKFTPNTNHMTCSPNDCLVLPVMVETSKQESTNTDEITIEIFSESTWGSTFYYLPFKYI